MQTQYDIYLHTTSPLPLPTCQTQSLSSLVQEGTSSNMRIDVAQIERSVRLIIVGKCDKHRAIDSWITLVCRNIGLDSLTIINTIT